MMALVAFERRAVKLAGDGSIQYLMWRSDGSRVFAIEGLDVAEVNYEYDLVDKTASR